MDTPRHLTRHLTRHLNCETTQELLPWLLNGSLEGEEREAVTGHLRGCEVCRGELEETAAVGELFDVHVPAWDLAAYSQGLSPAEWQRLELEEHLATCPRCRSELAGAQSTLAIEAKPLRTTARVGRPRIALAAAVVLAALLGFWAGKSERGVTGSESAPLQTAGATLERDRSGPLHGDDFESGKMTGWIVVSPTSGASQDTDSLDLPIREKL